MSGVSGGFIAPPYEEDEKTNRRRLTEAVRLLMQGKFNATYDLTLKPNETQTILVDPRIGFTSAVFAAMPLTANAAADIAAGVWFSGAVKGKITVNHRNNAATDRTIRFVIIG